MTIIKFDESCAAWTKINILNYQYLLRTCEYLKEVIRAKGYMYLNSIYDAFGAKWNPDWKNICYLNEFGVTFEVEPTDDNYFIIKIY